MEGAAPAPCSAPVIYATAADPHTLTHSHTHSHTHNYAFTHTVCT